MPCPYLEYRDSAGDAEFDHERAFCTAAEKFVQPMRADICNDRYELSHEQDCEIYREHSDMGSAVQTDGATETADE